MQAPRMRIGTRGSPLALAQTREVIARLASAHGLKEVDIETVVIKTTGDRVQDRPLADIGGKSLFTKELEEALLANTIDLAVHSMKDMAAVLPGGLAVGAVLPREDVRDGFISPCYANLAELPHGAVVGTSSVRRQAQVLRLRPDLKVVPFRGNVDTRIGKLAAGIADATFLAVAGLKRLRRAEHIKAIMSTADMLPAAAQGAIALEVRADDHRTALLAAPLNHQPTAVCVKSERAFLAALGGSCRTAIAALAEEAGPSLVFRGIVYSPDGQEAWESHRTGPFDSAETLGRDAALELLGGAGARVLAAAT